MTRTMFVSSVVALVAAVAAPVFADSDPAAPREKLGRVLFTTSCSPEAQKQFDRALAMLHSFYFPETIKAFSAIPATDPTCAIAYWGIAISQRPNPLVGPFDAAILKRGLEAIEKGEAIGAKTERERDWLAALKEFYKDYETVPQDTRTKNYEKAMEALVKKHPTDVEAKVFYALALNETFDHKNFDGLLKAARILEAIDKQYPDHPGVTHYLIHSYDFPPIARYGVAAADKYAKIAPAAPHARHMPSHIYSMLGMWDASIASNVSSVELIREYMAKNAPDAVHAGEAHALDFMTYAHLQLAQGVHAREHVARVGAVATKNPRMLGPQIAGYMALAAIPARYELERQDWAAAARLEPLGSKFPQAEAIRHFARAIGAARSGNSAAAEPDIDKLKEIRGALEKAGQSYWSGQVEIQLLAAQAWVAHGRGRKDDALRFMRAAADLEDASEKHVAMENRLYPMRELLGDMLRDNGDAAGALTEYEAAMKAAPRRLRGLYGAAKAAQATGDTAKATTYFRSLVQLAKNADGERPELTEARQFFAGRPAK
jgi:tetratricopeptide (TPR) repeat protein